jgi:DNA (cytosine-5)-methyltransferase 1
MESESGMWREMASIIHEVRPRYVFVENSPMLTSRGLGEFSETWPQWGLMRDGECWEQRTLEQTIRGTESGLSPNGVELSHAQHDRIRWWEQQQESIEKKNANVDGE